MHVLSWLSVEYIQERKIDLREITVKSNSGETNNQVQPDNVQDGHELNADSTVGDVPSINPTVAAEHDNGFELNPSPQDDSVDVPSVSNGDNSNTDQVQADTDALDNGNTADEREHGFTGEGSNDNNANGDIESGNTIIRNSNIQGGRTNDNNDQTGSQTDIDNVDLLTGSSNDGNNFRSAEPIKTEKSNDEGYGPNSDNVKGDVSRKDDLKVADGVSSNSDVSDNTASDSSDETVDGTNHRQDNSNGNSNSNDIADHNENDFFKEKENLVSDRTHEIDSMSNTFENAVSDEASDRMGEMMETFQEGQDNYKNQEHSNHKTFNLYDYDSDQNLFAVYGKLHVDKKKNKNDKQLSENSESTEELQDSNINIHNFEGEHVLGKSQVKMFFNWNKKNLSKGKNETDNMYWTYGNINSKDVGDDSQTINPLRTILRQDNSDSSDSSENNRRKKNNYSSNIRLDKSSEDSSDSSEKSRNKKIRRRKKSSCKKIDVIFVVDSSDDVSETEFRYIKQTLIKISKMLQNYRHSRMGVVSYGTRISDVIHLSNNASVMSRSIQMLKASGGSNKPYLGILAGRASFSDDISDSTKKIIVFIASGLQQYTKPTSQQAKMAREEGINVMTIGFGEGAVRHDLEEVASRRSMVYIYDRAAKIYENADKLPLYMCKAAKRRTRNDESNRTEKNSSSEESDEYNGSGSESDVNSRHASYRSMDTSTSEEYYDKDEGSGSGNDKGSYNESDEWYESSGDESDMLEKSDENDNSGNSSDEENSNSRNRSDKKSGSASSDESDKSENNQDIDASSSDESDNSNENSDNGINSSSSDKSSDSDNNNSDESNAGSSDSSNNSNDADTSSSDSSNNSDDSDTSSADNSDNSNDSDTSSADNSNNSNDGDTSSSDSSNSSNDGDASSSDSSNEGDDSSSDSSNEGDDSSSDSSDSAERWKASDSDEAEADRSLLRNKPEDLCRNSVMIRGVGYKVHPTHCDKFIQCYFDGFGNTRASLKTCPFGEYWDQHNVACVDAQMANCPNDPCKASALLTRAIKNSCRSYWGCHKGQSVVKCCPEKMSYQPRKGCVPDPDCKSECPPEEGPEYGTCDKKPLFGKPFLYKQWIESGHWVEMLCAPGTLFDDNDCGCTMRSTHMTSLGVRAIAKETCKPELYLPFCQGVKDWSNKNTLVQNEDDRVVVVNGKAYFDGKSSLFIPRFSGAHYGESIYIKIRYKPVFSDDAPDIQTVAKNEPVDETRRKRSILSRQRRDSNTENDGQNGDTIGSTNTETNQNVESNLEQMKDTELPSQNEGSSFSNVEINSQNMEESSVSNNQHSNDDSQHSSSFGDISNKEVNDNAKPIVSDGAILDSSNNGNDNKDEQDISLSGTNDINDDTNSINEKGLSDDTTINQADDNKILTSQSSGEAGNVKDLNSKNKDDDGDGNDNSISMSKSSGEIEKSADNIQSGKSSSDSDSGEQYSSFFETSQFDDQQNTQNDYHFDNSDNNIQRTVKEENGGNSNQDESYFSSWFSNGNGNSVQNDNSEHEVSSNVQNDKDSGSGESYFKNWFANSDEKSERVDFKQDQNNDLARSHINDGSSSEDNEKQNTNLKEFQSSSSIRGRKFTFSHGSGEKRDFYRDYSSDDGNNEGDAIESWENSSEENTIRRRKVKTRNNSDSSDDSQKSDDSSGQKRRRKNTRGSRNSDKDTDSDVSSAISEGYVDSNFELSSDFGNSNLEADITGLGVNHQTGEMYFAKTNIDEKRERLKSIRRIRRERNEMLREMENSRLEIINNVNLNEKRFQQNPRSDMALISNGACSRKSKNCLEDPSLSIGTSRDATSFFVYATESKRTNIKLSKSDNDDDDWRTVIFTINEGVFRAYDEDSTDFEPVSGPVKTTFAGIYIGQGTGMENFKGYMDEVYIYFCKPEELDDFKSMELPKKKTSSDDSCDYMNENIVKQNSESNEEIIVESVEPWWGE
ncbi:Protein PIF [Mytilus edulis]|uniref:Protein PIF n=1 Tax=Mytilus edulis TaxID=6550 RepID=A0A8S3SQ61_MYTED|nr:Protein PIF [Mytilus edulis]